MASRFAAIARELTGERDPEEEIKTKIEKLKLEQLIDQIDSYQDQLAKEQPDNDLFRFDSVYTTGDTFIYNYTYTPVPTPDLIYIDFVL